MACTSLADKKGQCVSFRQVCMTLQYQPTSAANYTQQRDSHNYISHSPRLLLFRHRRPNAAGAAVVGIAVWFLGVCGRKMELAMDLVPAPSDP